MQMTSDHQLVTGQAKDLNRLLEYYLGENSTVSDQQARDAWRRLAVAAHDKLGTGWSMTDVEQRFTPKRPDAWQYNPYDVEECDACTGSEVCPYHEGVGDGLGALRTAVEKLVDYPEQLHETLNYAEGAPSPSAPHRLVIDENCPYCGWAERWYIPEHGVFGCNKCPWRGSTRTT